jgi:hypothetical protein
MPYRRRLWRIHTVVSMPVSPAQCSNGRCPNSESIAPRRFSIEAISFELKEPALVTPGEVPQLHP